MVIVNFPPENNPYLLAIRELGEYVSTPIMFFVLAKTFHAFTSLDIDTHAVGLGKEDKIEIGAPDTIVLYVKEIFANAPKYNEVEFEEAYKLDRLSEEDVADFFYVFRVCCMKSQTDVVWKHLSDDLSKGLKFLMELSDLEPVRHLVPQPNQ